MSWPVITAMVSGSGECGAQRCRVPMKHSTVNLFRCMLVYGGLVATVSSLGKGPPRIDHSQAREVVVVRSGDPARLTCPIIADTHLLVQWTKDGETVDDTWPAFRISSRTLKVKTATESVSGVYVCRGISGYGTAQHEIKLIVIDPSRQSYGGSGNSFAEKYPSLETADFKLSPPKITSVYPSGGRLVVKSVGGRARFKCVAVGFPEPKIQWYKNGEPISGVDRSIDTSSPGQIMLGRLTLTDTATYQCRVSSLLGQDSAQFQLRVDDPLLRPPVIADKGLGNRTLLAGARLVLECRVQGSTPLHIKWLKRLSEFVGSPLDGGSSGLTTQVLDHHQYSVLNTTEPLEFGANEFVSRLVFTSAKVTDSGHFVCLAANVGGLTVRHFNVTVHKQLHGDWTEHSGELAGRIYLIFLVPFSVVLMLVCVALFSLYYRRSKNKCSNETKSDAEASLVGTDQVFLHLPSSSEKQSSIGTMKSSDGGQTIFTLERNNRCRYDRSDPNVTRFDTEHTYSRLGDGSGSGSDSCCSSGVTVSRCHRCLCMMPAAATTAAAAYQYQPLQWSSTSVPSQNRLLY